jgi:hypothetical protein
MSFATKYGCMFHMPFGSVVVYCGFVHVDTPLGGGGGWVAVAVAVGVGEGVGDGELADGAGDGWPPCDADGDGDAVRLPVALDFVVPEAFVPGFGMTATWGAAASEGSRAADALLAPPRPLAMFEVPAAAAGRGDAPCPLPRKPTAASPPPTNTAAVVIPMIVRRESGIWRNAAPNIARSLVSSDPTQIEGGRCPESDDSRIPL